MATGFVGGHAGNFIEETLIRQNIRCDFVHISGESRSCVNIYDETNHTQTEFLEPGVKVTEADKEAILSKYKTESGSLVGIPNSFPIYN